MSGEGKNRAVGLGIFCTALLLLGPYFGLHHLNSHAVQGQALNDQTGIVPQTLKLKAAAPPVVIQPVTSLPAQTRPAAPAGPQQPSKGQLALIEIQNLLK